MDDWAQRILKQINESIESPEEPKMPEYPSLPPMPEPPCSPDPIIPAHVSKWIWVVYTALTVTVLPTLVVIFPADSRPVLAATVFATSLGALLRMLTTNSFAGTVKPLLILLCLGSLTLPGCAWWQRAKPRLIDCAESSCATLARSMASEVADALQSPGTASMRLDGLRASAEQRGGQAAIDALLCAVVAMVDAMSAGAHAPVIAANGAIVPDPMQVRAQYGRAWLERQGASFKAP
jgi:hypothetical protein